jgi:hypothetical protein
MGAETVRITFPSGVEIFGTIAEVQTGAGYSKPRLLSVSNVYRAINKEKAFENSTIDVILDNTDGYFSSKMVGSDQYIKGKTLAYYDGADLIFSGKISDILSCDIDRFRIVADIAGAGFDALPNRVIKKSVYASVPPENEGKWGNIIAGTSDDTGGAGEGMLPAYRVNTNTFLAAWHHLHSLISVKDATGADITASCTLDNNADGNAYITYASSDLEIYFNCEGFEISSAFNENPASLLNELNVLFGSFTIDGVAAAEAVYADRGYVGASIVIPNDITWGEFLQQFSKNWDCMIYMQADGHLKIKVLDWGAETPVASIPEIYINDYACWMEIKEIVNEYRRMYWYHFRKDYFQRLPQDIVAATDWEAVSASLDLRQHSDDATSADVAAGILFFTKKPAIYFSARIEDGQAKTIDLGDAVNIRYDKGSYANEFRMMQVYRKEKVENRDAYILTGIDITEINAGLIRLYDEATDPECYALLNEAEAACGVLL